MDLVSEVTEQGVTERRFDLKVGNEVVPGIIWSPEGARGGRPLVLIGHGGTQHKRVPNVLSLARRLVRHRGYTAVAIDAPDHGDRAQAGQRRVAPEERRAQIANMSPEDWQRMAARNAGAIDEWEATLDALEQLDDVSGGPVGYWGVSMGTAIGLPFVASEPRVKAAVLGLAGLGNRPGADRFEQAARSLRIPILFLFQWDDELMQREHGLNLFDAIGSTDKTMHINPGGHVNMPLFERDSVEAFFARHLEGEAAPA